MPFDATPINDPVVTLLQNARDLVEQGWCQNNWIVDWIVDEPNRYCAAGAILHADNVSFPKEKQVNEAIRIFSRVIGEDHVPSWNDRAERQKSEVLVAFDKAIALASHHALVGETADATV